MSALWFSCVTAESLSFLPSLFHWNTVVSCVCVWGGSLKISGSRVRREVTQHAHQELVHMTGLMQRRRDGLGTRRDICPR